MKISRSIFVILLLIFIQVAAPAPSFATLENLARTDLAISETPPPVEKVKPVDKKKKKKLKKRRLRKLQSKQQQAPPKEEQDIVVGLYITFGVMFLLPLFVIIGFLFVGLGLPLLNIVLWGIGLGLIALGNIAALLAGGIAGASKTYGTQILSFAMWLFFGMNLAGGITLLILLLTNTLFFGAIFLWVIMALLFIFAIINLIWALIIHQQNKALRNSKKNIDESPSK